MGRLRFAAALALLGLVFAHPARSQDSPFGRRSARRKKPAKERVPRIKKGEKAAPRRKDERPPLDASARAEISRIAKEYFEAKPEDRPDLLAQVLRIEKRFRIDWRDIKKFEREFFNLARKGPRLASSGRNKFQHPDYPGEYIVRAGGSSLFIGLHGGGQGVGDAGQIAGLFGGGPPGMTVIFPTVIKKEATAWNTEREERYVLELIEAAKRTFNIDTNRIYLAGHSMGGYGTWSIGGRHADRFAAISPQAGGIFAMSRPGQKNGGEVEIMRGIVENLKNTPVYFYHGANDPRVGPGPDRAAAKKLQEYRKKFGPYDFVYKEYPNIGHGLPPGGVGPIWNWMKSKVRNPYPKFVIWEPTRPYKHNFYWLHLDHPGRGTRIEARIERGNRISLEGNFSGLVIHINEKMGLSLSRELVIQKSGTEVFRGFVDYSLAALLDSIASYRDPNMFFYARVEVP